MACGTGKTWVAIRTWEVLQRKTTIVFVPSLALMGQILDEFRSEGSLSNLYASAPILQLIGTRTKSR